MRALAPLAGLLALAACASNAPPPLCPPAGAVAGVERMTTFRPGGGEDLTEKVFEASIDGVDAVCEYDDDGLEMAMNVRLIAERGPADTSRQAAFQYFVAVEDGPGNITAKEIYDVVLPFEGNVRRVGTLEEVDVTVPAPQSRSFAGIRVLVGLQISREQVEYNRRTGRR